MDNISNYVYRVFRKEELEEFRKSKSFRGNKLDINSGFIHLCTDQQIKETINKYFKPEQTYIVNFKISDCLTVKFFILFNYTVKIRKIKKLYIIF